MSYALIRPAIVARLQAIRIANAYNLDLGPLYQPYKGDIYEYQTDTLTLLVGPAKATKENTNHRWVRAYEVNAIHYGDDVDVWLDQAEQDVIKALGVQPSWGINRVTTTLGGDLDAIERLIDTEGKTAGLLIVRFEVAYTAPEYTL